MQARRLQIQERDRQERKTPLMKQLQKKLANRNVNGDDLYNKIQAIRNKNKK